MAIEKPRRLRGTPAYRIRNYFAAGVLSVGTLIFAAVYAAVRDPVKDEKIRNFLKATEEEKERRAMMSFMTPRRGEEILKILEEIDEASRNA